MSYAALARELENRLGVPRLRLLPSLPECALESRHLGLITADEVADLQKRSFASWRLRRKKRWT